MVKMYTANSGKHFSKEWPVLLARRDHAQKPTNSGPNKFRMNTSTPAAR
jgi:hypothetical protein